ncbi:hypothetical protein BU15DRAFT_66513 [Melanogaster broomeanus]|nr:hypothetical protein BU15DRAFT_66513 [Melanogaster broomeanus]
MPVVSSVCCGKAVASCYAFGCCLTPSVVQLSERTMTVQGQGSEDRYSEASPSLRSVGSNQEETLNPKGERVTVIDAEDQEERSVRQIWGTMEITKGVACKTDKGNNRELLFHKTGLNRRRKI